METLSEIAARSIAAVLLLFFAGGVFPSLSNAAEFEEFGIESVNAAQSSNAAGAHADFTTEFVLNHKEDTVTGAQSAKGRAEEISVFLPPGLIGDPTAVPSCPTGQFETLGNCPIDSQVGVAELLLDGHTESQKILEPIYNLQPPHPHQEVARLGFVGLLYPIFIDVDVRTASDYGVTATVHDATGLAPLISAKSTLWADPASPAHDTERLTPFEAVIGCTTPCMAGGSRASNLDPRPFMSNPTACEEQNVGFAVTSYQRPGEIFEAEAPMAPTSGCEDLPFGPKLQLEPSSHRAGAPTGLNAVLQIPQSESLNVPASSALRRAKVKLPEGMTINPAAANGLLACSDGEVGLGTEDESGCPDGSKLGTATFVSPDLPEAIHGSIYQRTPASGDLFRIWLVADDYGLHLKLPGTIKANSSTGQLTAEFDETPQLPVEEIELEFRDGPRAALKNPDSCGKYSASYEFTPWSNPGSPVSGQTHPFAIDEGCGAKGFSPTLEAGVTSPVAGDYSPFVMSLKREDGEDNVSAFDLTLPRGELAKLKGVQLCPDGNAATGNCPAGAQIGSVAVSSGAGSQPLWIPQPGKAPTGIFLAGPYKGAPYSIVTKVPAQAGPFDLGTVAVRGGLYIDPQTTQATVKTDPLPQILQGVPVRYRTIQASVDRPEFAVNPTNCREQAIGARVVSATGAIATPSERFQVGECSSLGFGPTLSLHLKGSMKRGGYPALTATVQTHGGEANIGKASVALPHSEFLAQEHINTICTRVQFSEEHCPRGSIYGRAKAITPLLDLPLEGPVYLRSSSNPLPDLVVALHGQIDVDLVGRIDSVNGGIRTTFSGVPDAPVTRFILKMKGGRKSLLVNSTDICTGKHRATVKMRGQNGKSHSPHPLLSGRCK